MAKIKHIMMKKLGTGAGPVGIPTITGSAIENNTLTADASNVTSPSGMSGTYYQWYSGDVPTTTGSTYLLGDTDVGSLVRVEYVYTNDVGTVFHARSENVGPVLNINDLPVGSVQITGNGLASDPFTATSTITDVDGIGDLSYQWNKAVYPYTTYVPIAGAIGTTYVVATSDLGDRFNVSVSYTDDNGTEESVTSSSRPVVLPRSTLLAPSGYTLTQGRSMTDGNYYGVRGERVSDGRGAILIYDMSNTFVRAFVNPVASDTVGISSGFSDSGCHITNGSVLIGDPFFNLSGQHDSGRVYKYDIATGSNTYNYNAINLYGAFDREYTGMEISSSGSYVLISASYESSAVSSFTGAVHLYNGNTHVRTFAAPTTLPGGGTYTSFSVFGDRILLTPTYVVIADTKDNFFIYSYGGTLLRFITIPKSDGPNYAVQFELDYSGDKLYIGDRRWNGQDGQLLVYRLSTGSLLHQKVNPEPDDGPNDNFGWQVSIGGQYLAVSETYANPWVWIYNKDTYTFVTKLKITAKDSMDLTPDGTKLLVNGLYVYDLSTVLP